MKWIAPVVLLSTALAYAQAPAQKAMTPRQRPAKQYTMEQFLDTTSIQGASFSADESRILFSSNKTGIWNAYTVPMTGGAWTPITKSTKDSTYSVSFFRHDNRILITRGRGRGLHASPPYGRRLPGPFPLTTILMFVPVPGGTESIRNRCPSGVAS